MTRTHVIIIVIVLALAVGVVVFVKPGKASAAATQPGLGSGYAGDDAGEGWYGETPEPPAAPAPVKPSGFSVPSSAALWLVAPPVAATKLAIDGGKAVVSGGKKLLGKIF